MQKEIKYYTPTLDEFFFGFSFEFYNLNDWYVFEAEDGWKQTCFGQDMQLRDIVNINYAIQRDKIRVKYLDQEDIESLGFKRISENTFEIPYNDSRGFDDKIHMVIRKHWVLISQGNDEEVLNDWTNRFSGIIKNKSELIKLMKQLDICKKK